MKKFTSENFWEDYWKNLKLPKTIDKDFHQERVISEILTNHLPDGNGEKNCIEIGCAPGRWLIFFNKELNYKIDGIEYLDVACKKTEENFKLNGIEEFSLFKKDFFSFEIKKRYDLVSSFGFIEHFDNTEEVFAKHCALVNDNGYLAIGLPNLRGLNHIIQSLVDFWMPRDLRYLKTHNLKSMNIRKYAKYAEKYGFDILFLDYIGGFEPALFPFSYIPCNFPFGIYRNMIIKLTCKLGTKFHYSNKSMISSYILMIFKKK